MVLISHPLKYYHAHTVSVTITNKGNLVTLYFSIIVPLMWIIYLYTDGRFTTRKEDCTMAQTVICQPLPMKAWVQSQVSLCGLCGGQGGTGTNFIHNCFVFLSVLFHQCPTLTH
jgi:hypothetical protein